MLGDPGAPSGPPAALTIKTAADRFPTLDAAIASDEPEGTVSGGGFVRIGCDAGCGAPGAEVVVLVLSEPIELTRVQANSSGGYVVVVELPTELEPGTHHVVAQTQDERGRPTFIANTVTVVPPYLVERPVEVTTTTTSTTLVAAAPIEGRSDSELRIAALVGFAFGVGLTGGAVLGGIAVYLFMRRRTA